MPKTIDQRPIYETLVHAFSAPEGEEKRRFHLDEVRELLDASISAAVPLLASSLSSQGIQISNDQAELALNATLFPKKPATSPANT